MMTQCLRREYFQHSNLIFQEEELVHRFWYYFGASLSLYPDAEELAQAKADFIHGVKSQPERYPEWLPKEKEIIELLASKIDSMVEKMAPRVTKNGVEEQPLWKKFRECYSQIEQENY